MGLLTPCRSCAKKPQAISGSVFVVQRFLAGLMAWTHTHLPLIVLFSLPEWFSRGSLCWHDIYLSQMDADITNRFVLLLMSLRRQSGELLFGWVSCPGIISNAQLLSSSDVGVYCCVLVMLLKALFWGFWTPWTCYLMCVRGSVCELSCITDGEFQVYAGESLSWSFIGYVVHSASGCIT